MKNKTTNIEGSVSVNEGNAQTKRQIKNKGVKIGEIFGIVVLMVALVLIGGCIGGNNGTTKPSGSEGTELTGSLTITGSTTVLPIAQQAADVFMNKHSKVNIQVSGGGSSVGIQAVVTNTADIGMASRELKDKEKTSYPNLVLHVIASDGIAIIVHESNTVSELTGEQIRKIYKGEITNWKEVGGTDKSIVVVNRDSASGTREFFHEQVMKKENFTKTALEKNSNGAIKTTVQGTPGAIGYVSIGYVDAKVKALKVSVGGNFEEPTVQNVLDGKYPIARNLNMFTNGEATGLAKEYLDFIKSAEGQKLVEDEGFVPVNLI